MTVLIWSYWCHTIKVSNYESLLCNWTWVCDFAKKKQLNYGSKLPIKKVTQNNGNSKIKKKSLIKWLWGSLII